MAIDESKQIYGWFPGCVDNEVVCCCGETVRFGSEEEDVTVKTCPNCGQPWRATIKFEMIDEAGNVIDWFEENA